MSLLEYESLLAAMGADPVDRLIVTPLLDDRQVGPASIDLRLGSEFLSLRRPTECGLDPSEDPEKVLREIGEPFSVPLGNHIWLHPRQFVLGVTLEFVRLPPHLGAYVLGRSTWGRMGLVVATAIMVQPGFAGSLTLELVNEGESPIKLYPGLRVAQLAVHRTVQPTKHPYENVPRGDQRDHEGKAQYGPYPTGPQAARLAWDQKEIELVQAVGRALRST